MALSVSERGRSRWLRSYVGQVVTRDASQIGQVRDPARLRRYLQAVAANTAGVVVHKTLFDAAGIDRMAGVRFGTLLERVFVLDQVPPYSSNRLNRLVRPPKRYLIDSALMRPLLGIDERAVVRDGDLLGRVIDTFVVAQLCAELATSDLDPRLNHLRDANGRHEVDLVIELAGGRGDRYRDQGRCRTWPGRRQAPGVAGGSAGKPVRRRRRVSHWPSSDSLQHQHRRAADLGVVDGGVTPTTGDEVACRSSRDPARCSIARVIAT